jgi:hypothetical protein
MSTAYWHQVAAAEMRVPSDRPLADLTAELTTMLGSTDPVERDEIAYPVLATWLSEGVYDDLLAGLGDGMAAGLTQGLGESETDSVFRRSFSALMLAECVARDNSVSRLPSDKILEWGDRVAGWLVRERDVRGFVAGKGWAHAVAHGADAIGVLADSPHLRLNELTVLLDVVADRMLISTPCAAVWSPCGSSSPGSPGSPRPPSPSARRTPTRTSCRATPRRSCVRCTSRWPWPPSRSTSAPTSSWSWWTPCAPPTRRTSSVEVTAR